MVDQLIKALGLGSSGQVLDNTASPESEQNSNSNNNHRRRGKYLSLSGSNTLIYYLPRSQSAGLNIHSTKCLSNLPSPYSPT